MAVFFVIFGGVFFVVFGIISLIIRLVKKRINILYTIITFVFMIVAIVGFCMVPSEDYNYTKNSTNNKPASVKVSNSNVSKKQLLFHVMQGGESVLIQYSGKSILIDAPKGLNKVKDVVESLDKYNVKKIDSIILTSKDDNTSSNASDIITRYNISDVVYITDELNSKIRDAVKAVDSVKQNSMAPKNIKDADTIQGLDMKLLKNEKSQKIITFNGDTSDNINVIIDAYKISNNDSNISSHTIETGYNDKGYAMAKIYIENMQ